MKKIFVLFLFFVVFTILAFGQSGRKMSPTPTPAPKQNQEETGFSESKPAERITNRIQPKLRGNTKTNQSPVAKTQQNTETLNDSDDEIITVDTNLVTIPVSVLDRNGLYIPSLSQENFKIFEDGTEQEIAYFGTTEKPVTVVLLLDTSPSAERVLRDIKQAAIAFVNKLKPQDSVIVIEFAGNVHVLSEVTNDRQQIYQAINSADIGNGTVIYDAVRFTIEKRLNKIQGRKAIVLLTDGVDTFSKTTYDKSIDDAEASDTVIFPIYYNTSKDVLSQVDIFQTKTRREVLNEYILGKQYLKELADSTGGRVFTAEATGVSLIEAFEGIAEELRRQYVIGYYPLNAGQTGQKKQIKVRVNRPNLIVRAKDNYIVKSIQTK